MSVSNEPYDDDDEDDVVTVKGIPVGHLQEAVAATLR